MNFELTNGGEICSDIGKESIPDLEICKNAAKQLEKTFNEEIFNEPNLPTGCFYINNVLVGWNIYQIKSEIFGDIGEICLESGKYILPFRIFYYVHKIYIIMYRCKFLSLVLQY